MKNFFKKTDLPMRTLAVALAILLWGVAMTDKDPIRNHNFKTVPGSIELVGEDVLMEKHNLSVIDGQEASITFSAEGKASDISSLQKRVEQVRVIVDVSDIDTAGEHELRYTIRLPDSAQVSINDTYRTGRVRLTIDEVTYKDVPVSLPSEFGTAADGYLYGTPEVGAQAVRVDGPASILKTVSTARLALKADGLSKTQNMNCGFVLLDENGAEINSPHLSYDVDKVRVTVPVYKFASVPLEVGLRPSADITEDMAKVKIEPETVQIYGTESAVGKVKSIKLGEIDLGRVQTGARINMEIKLPSGVKLMEGQPATAAVTLQIDGVSSKMVKISDVDLIDTSPAEAKPAAELAAEAIEITLSGKNSALTALDPADIKVSITYDSSVYGIGTHMMPVQVELPENSGITVIGEDSLQAAVTISAPAETDTTDGGDNGGDAQAGEPET